jgi:hypothetical protein
VRILCKKSQVSLFHILILNFITIALSLIYPKKKTLNSWGIPDWKGKRNIFSSFEEHLLKVPSKETRFKVYEVEKVSVGVYTINGRVYAVTADFDNKEPLDLAVMDFFGKGLFEEVFPGNSFQALT